MLRFVNICLVLGLVALIGTLVSHAVSYNREPSRTARPRVRV